MMACGVLLMLLVSLPSFLRGQEPQRDDTHVDSVVRSAVADEFSSEILTNKTRAYLSCESGEMIVKINFVNPFRGVTYTDYDRTSACKFFGDGSNYYELRIPLKGCGTRQEAPRVFINNIIVRFHRSLELEEDEIKTIICRYPPPVAPLPGADVPPLLEPAPIAPIVVPPKLTEVELLLIICALLFLTLLLLGVGVAYYCLKKRNIKVVRQKKALSSTSGSVITRLSGATFLPVIEPMTIPRVVPSLSPSGSEAALLPSVSSHRGSREVIETIPSDYPSESPSAPIMEEEDYMHRNGLINNSNIQGYHMAFISGDFSERSSYPEDTERAQSVSSVPIPTTIKRDAKMIHCREARPRETKQQMLTTINEQDYLHTHMWDERVDGMAMAREEREVDGTVYTKTRRKTPSVSSYSPSLYGSISDNDNQSHTEMIESVPERGPPSVLSYVPSLYGSIPDNDNRSHTEMIKSVPECGPPSVSSYVPFLYGSIPDNDNRSYTEMIESVPERGPPAVSSYVPSLYGSIPDNDNRSHSEFEIESPVKPYIRKPKTHVATLSDYYLDTQKTIDIQEDTTRKSQSIIPHQESDTETPRGKALVPASHVPKFTVQNIDDVYLTTLTETHATERVTRHKKGTMEQQVKSPSAWDVTIPHYQSEPPEESAPGKTWDTFSEVSEKFRDAESTVTEPPVQIHSNSPPLPPETNIYPPNWDIIFRVLHPPPAEGVHKLTKEDKEKWKAVVSTDSTFRSLIQEATTTDDIVRISQDERYKKMYTPNKWHVIIRILTTPDYPKPSIHQQPSPDVRSPRYRKRSDQEQPRSRKSSLPPVHEIIGDPSRLGKSPESVRSRRTSRSGSVKGLDVRSMTEIDVDFARDDRESLWSVDTGCTYRTSRSVGERSTSEFLEEVPTVPSHRTSTQYSILERSTSKYIYSPEYIERGVDLVIGNADKLYDQSLSNEGVLGAEQGNYLERSSRPILERSSTEIIINSPILRAMNGVYTDEE
ncbi:uncharacterized protein LOC106474364 [Limulus polyphemus]|uniref:Uncharacterized protein LOC106474364 n=1 Tax=Limulus polyphemus TaxID=6850 RepID=A0ABM1TR77_LIMPO|nr:uncharacterized protein LOC106474364 [Limulus polyphemus]